MILKHLEISLIFTYLVCQVLSSYCPIPNHSGNIHSSKVLATLNAGAIVLEEEEDSQCYNYSLPYSFSTPPDVAISILDLQAQPSKHLHFFIKPYHSDSLSYIPFVIRTEWPYTKWNLIHFSFLAEDRSDIETGYYQIDSGQLSGCENGKRVDIIMPLKNNFKRGQKIHYSVFLHGFQISTRKVSDDKRSPLQLQIHQVYSNISGIVLALSVTSTTQVNFIYVSFIAYQHTELNIKKGNFTFDTIQNSNTNSFYIPEVEIPPNYARIYGLTGFLFNYAHEGLQLSTKWDGSSFTFNFSKFKNLFQYLSFSYIFFIGSDCQNCPGFEIENHGTCVSQCPIGTGKSPDNTCVECASGQQWNGTSCVLICSNGQYLNISSGHCQCPPTLNWNGQKCIACYSGKNWSEITKSCQCPKPLAWNGISCAKLDPCTNGKVFDVYTYACQCPETTFWNGQKCKSIPKCTGGKRLNINYLCQCPPGFVEDQEFCIYSPCFGGKIWTGSKCVCPAGLNYNGSKCIQCINGQKWDNQKLTCTCQQGYKWNGQNCQKSYQCGNGRVWNPIYQQCVCPQNYYWAGYTCLMIEKCTGGQYFDLTISKCVCLTGFQWDGKDCIQCNNGRIWNLTTLTCVCPPGTIKSKDGCRFDQVCSGGKQWCQNSYSCECPVNSIWNGNFCILNPCVKGQIWNQSIKGCKCPGNKVLINQTCVPPQISCTNGKIWNPYLYACACPESTFSTPITCDPIPVCNDGKIYNPLNNICQCPFGLIENNQNCVNPKCPSDQYWNGYQCQIINCPPATYYQKGRCLNGFERKCQFGYIWNGVKCSYFPNSCPGDTKWSGQTCKSQGKCQHGHYMLEGKCHAFPQLCPSSSKWDGSKCSIHEDTCPKKTYYKQGKCLPYQPCKNGFVWDPLYIQCICPPGTINSDNKCIQCPDDKKWFAQSGCACPEGSFDIGSGCQYPDLKKCQIIGNTIWINEKCHCRPGFNKVGFQCICYGTQVGDLCDKCAYKPNSKYVQKSNTCECKEGYSEIKQHCVPKGKYVSHDNPSKCSPGSYFDSTHRACLACTDGCLSCFDCYQCQVCRPEFFMEYSSQKCYEKCGDGVRLSLQCDDGNNIDGDGCSRDCRIQPQYTCTGGSPQSKDNCYIYRPSKLNIEQIGQIRKSTSIIINLKMNYMPLSLIQSQQCSNRCSQILNAKIIEGDKNIISITSQYLPGTKYIFSINLQFGRTFMSRFKLQVSISAAALKYFGAISTLPIEIAVEPSYLMSVINNDALE